MAGLLAAFNTAAATTNNSQVEKVDDAIVETGRVIAQTIEQVLADPEATATDKTKALYLTPHLVGILRELLATPAARKSVGLAAQDVKKASRIATIKGNIKKG